MNNRKKNIIQHALALFIENGITKTSIQQIADHAGISKGTFYNYFSSKTECIEAILEDARYEASLVRSDLALHKESKQMPILIDQISVISKLNRKLGLDVLFDEIMHSGELELKRLVLRHRLIEYNWFSERIIEIFGEKYRPFAFEAAIIFYGILHNINFAAKLSNHISLKSEQVTKTALHYLQSILHSLLHEETAVLNNDVLQLFFAEHLKTDIIPQALVLEKLQNLLTLGLLETQAELVEACIEEINRPKLRYTVIHALLLSMKEQFEQTHNVLQAKEAASLVLYYVKQQKNV